MIQSCCHDKVGKLVIYTIETKNSNGQSTCKAVYTKLEFLHLHLSSSFSM